MNWTKALTIVVGLWLLAAPGTFGYLHQPIAYSDWIVGILAILLFRVPFLICALGLWLQFAPLLFWTHSPAAYVSDTVMGILLLVFAFVVPNLKHTPGRDIPPGWSYNPSSWPKRIPVILLATLGWFCARYMSAFQLGFIDSAWDPVFGMGTTHVLTSKISKMFPISDAGLGATAYMLEALLGCVGDTKRWRSARWIVVFFGLLVVPLGFVSTLLIISQPIFVGSWCFICLCTAAMMLLMIAFTLGEVVALLQNWKAGDMEGSEESKARLFCGVTFPLNLVASALLGAFAMMMGAFIPGALSVVFSIISFAEVGRALRFLVVPFGIWVAFFNPIIGIALVILCIRKGKIKEHYGSWDKYIV